MLPVRRRRRSRIAHFKAPFVVAVLAPVALLDAGCGAEAEPPQDDLTGYITNPEACPDRIPAVGALCSHDELTCQYDAGSSCADPGRRCLNGIWQLQAFSCNPPPPRIETCPESPPEVGTSCASYEPALTCEYQYPYCFGFKVPLARCGAESLLWEAVPYACNPPPFACPVRPPALGSGCYYEAQQCDYGTCGDPADPRSTTRCEGRFWVEPGVDLCPSPSVDAGVESDGDAGASDGGVAGGG